MMHTIDDVPLYLVRLDNEVSATARAEDIVPVEAVRVNLIKIGEGRNAFYRIEPIWSQTSAMERTKETGVHPRVGAAELKVEAGKDEDANGAKSNDNDDDEDDDDDSVPGGVSLLEASIDTKTDENHSHLSPRSSNPENCPTKDSSSCVPRVSPHTTPSSSSAVVWSLAERYNEAEGKRARKAILEEVSCLNLPAEEKASFFAGVIDGGPTVAVLADRFRHTKEKEARRAIRKEVCRLGLGAIFEVALAPGRKT